MFKKVITLSLLLAPLSVYAVSPYAGQQERKIKALSDKEVSGLLAGKGMGMAKAGELNNYPGPKHVLELVGKMDLSSQQLEQTKALFNSMQKQAIVLGKKIIEKEQQLDDLFATQSVSDEKLNKVLQEIGRLRAELRYVHLKTHLQQKKLMSEAQIKHYDMLRGYSGSHGGHGMHHHNH